MLGLIFKHTQVLLSLDLLIAGRRAIYIHIVLVKPKRPEEHTYIHVHTGEEVKRKQL